MGFQMMCLTDGSEPGDFFAAGPSRCHSFFALEVIVMRKLGAGDFSTCW